MMEANETTQTATQAVTGALTTPRRWRSLLPTLKAFAMTLDYDPHRQASASINDLSDTVSPFEMRLTALEQSEDGSRASAATVLAGRG